MGMASALHASSPDFLTVGEAATRLGMSANSVKRRLDAGILRGYRDPDNGYHYITVESVDRLADNRRRLREAALLPGRNQSIGGKWGPAPGEDSD
jgi:hypothetical protein